MSGWVVVAGLAAVAAIAAGAYFLARKTAAADAEKIAREAKERAASVDRNRTATHTSKRLRHGRF